MKKGMHDPFIALARIPKLRKYHIDVHIVCRSRKIVNSTFPVRNAEEVGNTIRSLRFYRWSMAGLCMGNCEQSIYYADHSVCENEDPVASTIILVFAAFLFGFQVNEFLEPIKSTPINLEP